jgi:acyl-coenzyme A synthetase/AMP-(fatty) acid ligase
LNSVELAVRWARDNPQGLALWLPGRSARSTTRFGELLDRAARVQGVLQAHGLRPGDAVLVLDSPGPRLYATVMAVLAMGASIILVEPWMRLRSIDLAVRTASPTLYVANWFGWIWGAGVPAVRAIRQWVSARSLDRAAAAQPLRVEPVDANTTGVLTFTSGTTGVPKGVVRTHGLLLEQHQVLSRSLQLHRFKGPDLCVLPNFVLANLASGRGTLLVPPAWSATDLRRVDELTGGLRPETTTCGPGFLLRLMRSARASSLRSIHVGGALTDCWILEEGFQRWPDAAWHSVYGSTEAEPVAVGDAPAAVRKSRAAGYFQTLYLGHPVPEIRADVRDDGLWVAGPHVCPFYVGDIEANRTQKRRDGEGRIWHCMGDRVGVTDPEDGGWWYQGRTSQLPGDFALEQQVYARLGSSKSFIHRAADGRVALVGEGVGALADEFPGVDACVEARIYRDPRHRARIDRRQTLRRGPRWLLG